MHTQIADKVYIFIQVTREAHLVFFFFFLQLPLKLGISGPVFLMQGLKDKIKNIQQNKPLKHLLQ